MSLASGADRPPGKKREENWNTREGHQDEEGRARDKDKGGGGRKQGEVNSRGKRESNVHANRSDGNPRERYEEKGSSSRPVIPRASLPCIMQGCSGDL